MKKLIFLITIIMTIFISFIVITLIPKNYNIIYKINDVEVNETYEKEEKGYLFLLKYKENEYPLFINKKHTKKRKLINKLNINELDKEVCLSVNIQDNIYNLCSNEKNLIDINLMSDDFKAKFNIKENSQSNILNDYLKINIYDQAHNYIIWNYKGFINLNENHTEAFNVLNNDNYQNELGYQTNDYYIFPDYDSKYFFNKMYIYNIKKNKLESINFDYEISYESYYLGNIGNNVYILDKKNKKQYKIDLKKQKIEIIGDENKGIQIYENEEFITYNASKIILNNIKFPEKEHKVNYIIDDKNNLYMTIDKYKIKITNQKVTKIIKSSNTEVFYLVNDTLYKYSLLEKEQKLLQYKEWNFNNINKIFIFN